MAISHCRSPRSALVPTAPHASVQLRLMYFSLIRHFVHSLTVACGPPTSLRVSCRVLCAVFHLTVSLRFRLLRELVIPRHSSVCTAIVCVCVSVSVGVFSQNALVCTPRGHIAAPRPPCHASAEAEVNVNRNAFDRLADDGSVLSRRVDITSRLVVVHGCGWCFGWCVPTCPRIASWFLQLGLVRGISSDHPQLGLGPGISSDRPLLSTSSFLILLSLASLSSVSSPTSSFRGPRFLFLSPPLSQPRFMSSVSSFAALALSRVPPPFRSVCLLGVSVCV